MLIFATKLKSKRMRNQTLRLLTLIGLGCCLNLQAQETTEAPRLTAHNIEEVVAAMTLEEKAMMLTGNMAGIGTAAAGGDMIGRTEILVPGAAGTTYPITRLGIPPTVMADGPAGLRIDPTRNGDDRTYYCTGFPTGICLAASWNTALVEHVGEAIGNEVHEYGADVLLAPGMNIMRHPLCGRNFEYYSEDPLLAGKIAAAYIRGVQQNGVGTSIKHFAANNQETNRMNNDARISQRALREIYLRPFEIAVKEAKPWTVMSSYNKVNGVYTQDSHELLTNILRNEWGYEGIVVTDWTMPRKAAMQIAAGNDLLMPGLPQQQADIIQAVKDGTLKIEDVDQGVKRILAYIVKTPRFQQYAFSNQPDLKAHATVARQSAAEGMVLLKNDEHTLPLPEGAGGRLALFGINSYDLLAGGTGSGDVNKAYVVDLLEGLRQAGFTVSKDLQTLYESYRDYARKQQDSEGYEWYETRPKLTEMPISRALAEQQAATADVALVTISRLAGEGSDRTITDDFRLTATERQMLDEVTDAFHAQGKRVVVVLNVGGAIETASWKDGVDAILMAWQAGQEGGNSIADVLTGKVSPSGRLPLTFPINIMDEPSSKNFPLHKQKSADDIPFMPKMEKRNVDYTEYEEGIYVGYRFFCTTGKRVSYPFGYGLSYTTFAYSQPKVTKTTNGFQVKVTVSNTGQYKGKEVVQLYVSAPSDKLDKPIRELKAFAKTKELAPGERETLTLTVANSDLASYDEAQQAWVTAKGQYQIQLASNAEDIRVTANYDHSSLRSFR